MTNRKRNINRVRRRQRAKMARTSATSTSEKYTEEEVDFITANTAEAIVDSFFMILKFLMIFFMCSGVLVICLRRLI